jgi:hypothetical protein
LKKNPYPIKEEYPFKGETIQKISIRYANNKIETENICFQLQAADSDQKPNVRNGSHENNCKYHVKQEDKNKLTK